MFSSIFSNKKEMLDDFKALEKTSATTTTTTAEKDLYNERFYERPKEFPMVSDVEQEYVQKRRANNSTEYCDLSRSRLLDTTDLAQIAIPAKKYNLSHNLLTSLPTTLPIDANILTSLKIANNQIKKLDANWFKALVHVQVLDLSCNEIKVLPVELFESCTKLIKLNVSRNVLEALPKQVQNLVHLEELDIRYNYIKDVPSLESLTKLRLLLVARHVDGLEKGAPFPNITNAKLQSIVWMHMMSTEVDKFCPQGNLLESVIFKYNKIAQLPVFKLAQPHLKILHLSHNMLKTLPSELAAWCPNVTKLYLNVNSFEQVPSVIWQLKELEELDLGFNYITELPSDICLLQKLVKLNLDHNHIINLPVKLCELRHLKQLIIQDNPLNTVLSKLSTAEIDVILYALQGITKDPLPPVEKVAFPILTIKQYDNALVRDMIKGCIYGHVLGDAFGLASEFLNGPQARATYGIAPLTPFIYLRDMHRRRWIEGDWTDDSDQMLLIMDTILANNKIDENDFANRLFRWIFSGYDILGDEGGMGLGQQVKATVCNKLFLQNPLESSVRTWNESGKKAAANGGIMRTSIIGAYHYNDLNSAINDAIKVCKTTHVDPRCTSGCVAVCSAIVNMIQYCNKYPTKGLPPISVIDAAFSHANKLLVEEPYKKELQFYMYAQSWQELNLDEGSSIGYTNKALGAAFYCLRKVLLAETTFEQCMWELTMQAGDADSNAAVAGALCGTAIGYNKLPKEWLTWLPHKNWLDNKIEQLFKHMNL